MAGFVSSLSVKSLGDGNWQLTAPLIFQSSVLRKMIDVPDGFETDFASVPRVPVAYLLTANTANASAVVHDYLYRTIPHICKRRQADLVFLEAMKVEGIPLWRREMMYLAVRCFGWKSWR